MHGDDPIDLLIAYAEGQLPPEQRAAFERQLAASPQLQQELALLRQVDGRLAENFAAPRFVKIDFDAARAAVKRPPAAPWKRWAGLVGFAAAAAVALTFLAPLLMSLTRTDPTALTVSGLYDDQVKGGFVPNYVCKDDAEFVEYSRQRLGLPLLARSDGSVQIVGWSYADTNRYDDLGLSRGAQIILARVDQTPVLLFLDKAGARGPRLDPAAKGRLNVFRTTLGGVEIFEVTPLDKSVAATRFQLAE